MPEVKRQAVTRLAGVASNSIVKTFAAGLLCLNLLCLSLGQSLGQAQDNLDSTIRSDVPLVLAPVTVTDKKGNSIDGLTADDFRLTDDNVARKIRVDTSDTVDVEPVLGSRG